MCGSPTLQHFVGGYTVIRGTLKIGSRIGSSSSGGLAGNRDRVSVAAAGRKTLEEGDWIRSCRVTEPDKVAGTLLIHGSERGLGA